MIEKIIIKNVGPIKEKEVFLQKNNLIVGNNESGKTTITDLLEKHLLKGRKKSDLNLLSRLSGFNEERFGGAWNFEIIGESGIEWAKEDTNFANLINLLVVREGSNRLTDRDNKDVTFSDFWKTSIRTLLGGFDKTGDKFEKLKKYLTTSSGPWKIIDTLENYKDRLIEEKRRMAISDISNEEIEDNEKKLKEKTERLETLSKIEKANEYYEAEQKFIELIKLSEAVKETKRYLADNDVTQLEAAREDWKECNKKKSDYEKERSEHEKEWIDEKNEILKKISNKESERKILTEREKKLEERKNELHNRSIRLENEMENEQAKMDEKIKNLIAEKDKLDKKYDLSGMFLLPVILFLSGICSFALTHLIPHIIFISFFIMMFGLSWIIRDIIVFNGRKKEKTRRLEKIEEGIGKYKDELERIEDKLDLSEQTINETIANTERELKEIKLEIANINIELSIFQKEELEKINEKYTIEMREIEETIQENQYKLDNYLKLYGDQAKLGGKIFEYHSKEEDLEEDSAELQELTDELKDIFDMEEILIARVENKLEVMKKNIDKSYIDMDYTPEEREQLIQEINELKEKKYDRSSEISGIRSEIVGRLSKDFSNISSPVKWGDKFFNRYFLPLVVNLKVTNVYELDRAIKRTTDAIEQIKKYKSYSEKMLEKIREIENNQVMLAGNIINSRSFNQKIHSITGYEIGKITQNEDRFRIAFQKGETTYFIEDLSTGALNQFYFVLRVALAERVLPQPALFILDDAFIHFDQEKRRKSFELLKKLTEDGWQFIYTGVADGNLPHLYKEVFGEAANLIEL